MWDYFQSTFVFKHAAKFTLMSLKGIKHSAKPNHAEKAKAKDLLIKNNSVESQFPQ